MSDIILSQNQPAKRLENRRSQTLIYLFIIAAAAAILATLYAYHLATSQSVPTDENYNDLMPVHYERSIQTEVAHTISLTIIDLSERH